MEYKYDPILCMNVPDSTGKAKDAKAFDDARSDFSKVIALTKQIDEITRKYARKIDANAIFTYTDQIRNKVQYYIDNASRGWYDDAPSGVRDANKKEGFVIHSAQIKGNKIAVVIEDLLYSPGKKEIEEFTKEEASKIKNDPWTTWKGNSKSVLEKFISSRDSKTVDKAIKACDEERKIGEFGGIKYEITENSDGSFNIKLNGQPHKNHARFSSLREAEKNVQMNIGEILSYERATGKKALIRNFA